MGGSVTCRWKPSINNGRAQAPDDEGLVDHVVVRLEARCLVQVALALATDCFSRRAAPPGLAPVGAVVAIVSAAV